MICPKCKTELPRDLECPGCETHYLIYSADPEQTLYEIFYAWVNVPAHLKTRTQLGREGLRLGKDQKQEAVFCSFIRGKHRPQFYKLYDIEAAVPKREVTPEQLELLATNREKSLRLRTCAGGCGYVVTPKNYGNLKRAGSSRFQNGQFFCRFCFDHRFVVEWARAVLLDTDSVIIDTESTGLEAGDEVIEVAIISITGEVLFNSLVKPQGEMGATHIHGITAEDVAKAPTWPEVDSEVMGTLSGASRVLAYGARFDRGMIEQTRKRWGLTELPEGLTEEGDGGIRWDCVMHAYSAYVGDWSHYWKDYRWQRLGGSHRALGDCLVTLERIKEMAESEKENDREAPGTDREPTEDIERSKDG